MLKPSLRALFLVVAFAQLASGPALSQRRIIGAEERTEEEAAPTPSPEDETDPKKKAAAEKKKKEEEEKKKKQEAEAKKKQEEEERKAAAKAAAEEAAQKAADEAERKKQEEEARKKKEAEEREQKRLEQNRDARLKGAKKIRKLTREDGNYVAAIALEPGKPEKDKVSELRLELTERLEVAHPQFGNLKPLKDLELIATVEEPATGKGKAQSYRYLVQPLRAPGSYGMHHTPRLEGEHTVSVEGRSKKGDVELSFSFPLHVGVWPPPGFDEEEAKNAKENAGRAAGSRRIVGSN